MPADPSLGPKAKQRGTSDHGARDAVVGGLIAGRYRVHDALGKGGMANVWRVRDEIEGRDLALKQLSKGASPRIVALFEREFHTLATLQHPCIVKAFDYTADAEQPFYTMELLVGSDVSSRAPMRFDEVCRILRDVASALALLHVRRFVHRDLSARNVWLTPHATVKLIDFGTMTPFGRPPDVAGTPPYIAPESMSGGELDQRTDLYALGALGYYLLTGRHAYPALSLLELPTAWRERPRQVSKRVGELGRADLPEVPKALDALIEALLSQDPLARPPTMATLIDRLTLIAGLPRLEEQHVAESYLVSPAFVGRRAERTALRQAMNTAAASQASTVLVESAAGLGRTRLLSEFALEARLNGAIVLQVEPNPDAATHEVALQYAFALLAALPGEAQTAAAPHADTLAHLSPALRERLGVTELAAMPEAHGEARMRVQAALRDWFLTIAKTHFIVLIADDFDAFDDGSAAWLTALARAAQQHRLLSVAAAHKDATSNALTIAAMRQNARNLMLEPVSPAEMSELFRSVFGDTPYLARLVDLVQQLTEGNPGHAMDLAEHLTREGTISLSEGAWILPQSIAAGALPANRTDAEIARLGRLPAHARQLGQSLSVREGTLPLDMCTALAEIEGQRLYDALEALVREGVLHGSAQGYRFTRESLRKHLQRELDDARQRRAHARLGEHLLRSTASPLDRLKGGVHLLLGGNEELGSATVAEAGKHFGLVQLADLGPAAPALEKALEHFRATGRSQHEVISVLAPLALAGYYADRRLAVRFGADAVDALETVVGLKRARVLRPYLGRKLSLVVALGIAAIVFASKRGNTRVPTFRETMLLLFNCVAALTGVCTICIDAEGGRRYAAVIEPLTALGPDHVASFMHRFCLNLVATVADSPGEASDNWGRMLERLDRPNAVRDLPANVHSLYLGGALYARGVTECWRDRSQALEYAERLQALQLKLYQMSADQVRMMYYGNRGNLEQFHHYRQQVEVHAIQRGTAWQVETWTYSGLITIYARTGDVAGLKGCVEQLKRLSTEVPTLRIAYLRALSAYLLLRGTPNEALPIFGQDETPGAILGWVRGEGLRARAYNALGQHARAKDICVATLTRLSIEDRAFCALTLGTEIELARAEAGLGDPASAVARLTALLDMHAPAGNPLTIGALHEALAELARVRGDRAAFERHLEAVAEQFRSSRDPALVARHARLARLGSAGDAPAGIAPEGQTSSRPPGLMTVVHRLRHGGDDTISGSAVWALKQLSELTSASAGYLFVPDGCRVTCAARCGSTEAESELAAMVAERLNSLDDEDSQATSVTDGSVFDLSRLEVRDRVYRLNVLRSADAGHRVLGAIVLAGETSVPVRVLQAIADRMTSTRDDFPAT